MQVLSVDVIMSGDTTGVCEQSLRSLNIFQCVGTLLHKEGHSATHLHSPVETPQKVKQSNREKGNEKGQFSHCRSDERLLWQLKAR